MQKLTQFILINFLLLTSFLTLAETPSISANDLIVNQMSDKAFKIIDVRTPEEFAAGHIKGAINIPYDQIEAQTVKLKMLKRHTLVVYCRSGRRARIFEGILQKRGFNLKHLEGDYLAWKAAQLPLIIDN
ncbi:rhodanese-like domain-containing protein [Pseudoalteromonas luteoviolacea]|uniref:rhodanese-like domain-containing protein n=1 Tax=Pseudoalteromonas luteoviolacea TaxID=43657 RepID=UPI001151669B|nr:rhodanese-like domain-containing protein [Pseudoalteromonas luteoviolacea]TQF69798.1 rhodanese-like domain-containing protein [Pseudoalteromonas luteoviolacea]